MNNDSKIRAIIIEDEDHNREHLITLLKQHCPLVNVVGHATGVNTGYDLIAMHKPDLLFLDIQLIDGTGFDLLEKFEKIDFKVIFATAYESYAIRAFRFSALDYLLKPLDPIELKSAVEKAEKQIESEFKLQVNTASNTLSKKRSDKLVLKDIDNIYLINLTDISYCEADGNYTKFNLISEKPILVSKPIKEYDMFLKDSGFLRIHRSYLINTKHIKKYIKQDGGTVILIDDSEVPVASGRREELMEFIERLNF